MRNSKKKPIFNLETLLKARKSKCAVCKSNLRDNQTLRKKNDRIDQHTNSSSDGFKRFKDEGSE